jgi:hypothetical protein
VKPVGRASAAAPVHHLRMEKTALRTPFWLRLSEPLVLSIALGAFWLYVIATKLIVRSVLLAEGLARNLASLDVYALQHLLMLPVLAVAYWLALRIGWPAARRGRAVLAHGAIVVAVGLIGRYAIYAAQALLPMPHKPDYVPMAWTRMIVEDLQRFVWLVPFTEFTFQYLCGLGIAAAIVGWRGYQQQAAARGAEAHELTRARLAALRRQIDPHFLFNTLNSIAARLPDDPHGANDMLMRTARLLRRTTDDERERIPLAEEVQIAREYLELHAQRFPDRLRVRIALDESLREVEVPSLLLQPLVENAALHGLDSDSRDVLVSVDVEPARDARGAACVRIEIGNTAAPDSVLPDPAHSPGVGLRNTWARLRTTYAERFALTLRREGGRIVLRLDLPLEAAA